jgi:hypothetical protein
MAHKWQRMALDALGQLNKLKKRAEVTLERIRGFVSEHHQEELKDQPNWEQEVNGAVMELVDEKTVQQKADGSFGMPKKANWKRGKPKKKAGRSSALQRNDPIDEDGDAVEEEVADGGGRDANTEAKSQTKEGPGQGRQEAAAQAQGRRQASAGELQGGGGGGTRPLAIDEDGALMGMTAGMGIAKELEVVMRQELLAFA